VVSCPFKLGPTYYSAYKRDKLRSRTGALKFKELEIQFLKFHNKIAWHSLFSASTQF
jgi:hypothetical protein